MVAYTKAAPSQSESNESRDRGDEGFDPEETDSNTISSEEDSLEEESLTPGQRGRLARFNGNFYQLYGAASQLNGNLDAIAGNQLRFRGELIEFLGNEHTLRGLGNYLSQVKEEHDAQTKNATGREQELMKEESEILGELRDLVLESAAKEHEQAESKASQFNMETSQYRHENEELELKAGQAISELEQGNIEAEQIKLEMKGRAALQRLIEIQKERKDMEESTTEVNSPNEEAGSDEV